MVLLITVYAAAKIHFFTRYFAVPLEEYWAEHWPFTAGLAVLSGVLWLAAAYLEKKAGRHEGQ